MKVIDLFNKIANEEEVPKKIKYADYIYYLDNEWEGVCYKREDDYGIFEDFFVFENLNDEVEVIEDTPKEYINVSEEQVLFNNLSYEEQQFILKQMRMLQPPKEKANGE
jgi:hypothetical protein